MQLAKDKQTLEAQHAELQAKLSKAREHLQRTRDVIQHTQTQPTGAGVLSFQPGCSFMKQHNTV